MRYTSTGKRVALQTTWIENIEQGESYMLESGQHSGESEEAQVSLKEPSFSSTSGFHSVQKSYLLVNVNH